MPGRLSRRGRVHLGRGLRLDDNDDDATVGPGADLLLPDDHPARGYLRRQPGPGLYRTDALMAKVQARQCDVCDQLGLPIGRAGIPYGWLLTQEGPNGPMQLYCSWGCLAAVARGHVEALQALRDWTEEACRAKGVPVEPEPAEHPSKALVDDLLNTRFGQPGYRGQPPQRNPP